MAEKTGEPALTQPLHASRRYLFIALGLLLLHFFIRSQDITRMDPYVDEGTHMMRAAQVWSFTVNPGQFSNGKLLLYYWLGLFDGPPETNLAAGRLSIALFSTLTAAAIYALGRFLFDASAGLLALAAYAVLPLAFFFERMALADPFAAGFAALLAWRSLIFSHRPTLRQGAIIGLLLALATMAKLTMVLLPLLPLGAALLWTNWHGGLRGWLRRYLPGLILAAGVVALLWAFVLIPAYFAQGTDMPFVLVDEFNVDRGADLSILGYLQQLIPALADFTAWPLLLACGVSLLGGLLLKRRKAFVYLGLMLLALSVPMLAAARLVTARYFMPLSIVLALLLALGLRQIWILGRDLPAGRHRGAEQMAAAVEPALLVERPAGAELQRHQLRRLSGWLSDR